MDDELLRRVRAWAADDPDPVTRAELERLVAAGDDAGLADRFAGTLQFGTAGLRGALGAGPNRMNRVVVLPRGRRARRVPRSRASAAARWSSGTTPATSSDVFADDTAEVMTRRRPRRLAAAAPAADAGARVRRSAHLGCGRRGDGHREPQPAAGQRLQGLPRRRRADRAAGRRGDRRPRSTRSGRSRDVPRGRRLARSLGDERRSSAYLDAVVGRSVDHGAARPAHRLHAAARRRRRDVALRRSTAAGFARAAWSRRAGRAGPRLPDRGLPQPRGAGRDRPGAGLGRRDRAPTS